MNKNILEKEFSIFFKIKEMSDKITTSLPFKILVVVLISAGLYDQLYAYKYREYGIDKLKYILILDKNAELINMRCRDYAKYSFQIKANKLNQDEIISILKKNGWRKYEEYGGIDLINQRVQISMSAGNEYISSIPIRLLWQW